LSRDAYLYIRVLKGTMSEAELHLRSRLRGEILNKARRGELAQRLPVGLVGASGRRTLRDQSRRTHSS
jgi:hypothetical protein